MPKLLKPKPYNDYPQYPLFILWKINTYLVENFKDIMLPVSKH